MKKLLIILCSSLMSCLASFGQKEEWGTIDVPTRMDWWISASAGSTLSFADNAPSNNFVKNFPSIDVQLGTFFSRAFGVRFGASVARQSGEADDAARSLNPEKYDTYYHFYLMHAYADGVLDITTLLAPRRKYRPKFDVMVFAGPALVEAVHFDMKLKDWFDYPVDYHDKTCWSFHAGLMTAYRLTSHWDWSLEASYNMIESRYDGVEENASLSGFLKFHTGLVYHIYDRRDRNRYRLTTDIDSDWAPRYTEKDREKIRQEERQRIQKARKELEKRRATKSERIRQHNEDVKKANEQIRKRKENRAKEWEEREKYNENVIMR